MHREKKKYRKKQSLRFKRMDPVERLADAKSWLIKHEGKSINIAKNYRNRYGVGWERAFDELKMLSVKIHETFIKEKLDFLKTLPQHRAQNNQVDQNDDFDENIFDEDRNFSFIIGHTSNGMPFGTSREE